MNNIVDKIESKIRDYKKGKDYEFVADQEKKIFIVTNEELKKTCWEIFPQIVSEIIEEKNKNNPVIKIWSEKDKLFFQIGETAEEKKEREAKVKETEAIVKESERIAKKSKEIVRRSEEIRQETKARTEKNQEHEKQSKQENQEVQQVNQPKPNYKILPWILGGTVILLVAGMFAYLFTKKNK